MELQSKPMTAGALKTRPSMKTKITDTTNSDIRIRDKRVKCGRCGREVKSGWPHSCVKKEQGIGILAFGLIGGIAAIVIAIGGAMIVMAIQSFFFTDVVPDPPPAPMIDWEDSPMLAPARCDCGGLCE